MELREVEGGVWNIIMRAGVKVSGLVLLGFGDERVCSGNKGGGRG